MSSATTTMSKVYVHRLSSKAGINRISGRVVERTERDMRDALRTIMAAALERPRTNKSVSADIVASVSPVPVYSYARKSKKGAARKKKRNEVVANGDENGEEEEEEEEN